MNGYKVPDLRLDLITVLAFEMASQYLLTEVTTASLGSRRPTR